MANIEHYLNQLNQQQKEAVLENSRPLLVLAGAGSGKTRVITTKIAYALEILNIQPYEILAVTFTNKAAKEMRDRVESMVESVDTSSMHIRTFHSFGSYLLRRYAAKLNLKPSFTIYDDEDSLSLLASCFPSEKKSDLAPVAKAISLAKDRNLTYQSPELKDFRYDDEFPNQFKAYQQKLEKIGNVDFADLISRPLELLKKDKEVAAQIQNRFKMILVDEYQDSNIAQFELLKELVGKNTFICVVGDDDQSIYRFRGAEVENILSFPTVYPNTKTIKLEQNYRSTKRILDLASSIIKNNHSRHPKKLWTDSEEGSSIRLINYQDERDEASRIVSEIVNRGIINNSAILYRTNAQSVAFEKVLAQRHIPYKIVGSLKFFDREEVKDSLALLSLMLNKDDEISFKRVVNKPTRGLGAVTINKVVQLANQTNTNLIDALKVYSEQKNLTKGSEFAQMFDEAEKLIEQGLDLMLRHLLQKSQLISHYLKIDRQNETDRSDNLENLILAVGEYENTVEGLTQFLESLTLDPTTLGYSDPSEAPGVTLITMHNTKGLEFDNVYITGLEEGLFPSRACETNADLEEERRIFYVALTRAKENLTLSYASRRMIWGRINHLYPSRFVRELDDSLIEKEESFNDYNRFDRLEQRRNANIILNKVNTFSKTEKVEKVERVEVDYQINDKVQHKNYGDGVVVSSRKMRSKTMIDVKFNNGSTISFFNDTPLLKKL